MTGQLVRHRKKKSFLQRALPVALRAASNLHPYAKAGYKAASYAYKGAKSIQKYTRKAPVRRQHNISTTQNYGLSQDTVKVKMGMRSLPYSWLESDKLQRISMQYTNPIEIQTVTQQQQFCPGEMIWNPIMFTDVETQMTTNTGTTANLHSVQNSKLRIGTYEGVATILNQTNTPITVTVYTCQFRQDQQAAFVRWLSSAPTTYTNTTAYIDLDTGLATTQPYKTATYSRLSPYQPSVTPYQSPYFCSKYKIVHTKKIELNSGATCKHIISDCRKQEVNTARLVTTAAGAQGNLSYFRLYRVQGTVANAGAGTVPGIAKAEVSILEEHKYKMALCPLNQIFDLQNHDIFPTIGMNTVLATATTDINEMTNVSTVVTTA